MNLIFIVWTMKIIRLQDDFDSLKEIISHSHLKNYEDCDYLGHLAHEIHTELGWYRLQIDFYIEFLNKEIIVSTKPFLRNYGNGIESIDTLVTDRNYPLHHFNKIVDYYCNELSIEILFNDLLDNLSIQEQVHEINILIK